MGYVCSVERGPEEMLFLMGESVIRRADREIAFGG
jgi:hypothetical protein